MKWLVVTPSLMVVFEADSKRLCNSYVRQAVCKGSKPGFLSIISCKDYDLSSCC